MPGVDCTGTIAPDTFIAAALDLANRLKAIVAELETGAPTEPGDRLMPSEKLRAIADLIDRRAATAAPPTES